VATFGSQTTTSSLSISVNNKRGCKFTAPSDVGAVVSISAYANRTATGSGYAVDAAIYADNAGAPGALVANSVINLSSNIARNAPAWYTGTYGTPPTLTPGAVYWLCQLHTKAGLTYYAAGGANQQGTNADTLPFDDPFGTPSYANSAMAIYVTYNPPQNRAQVSWAEMEAPNAPRRGRVSFAELESPNGPRRGRVSWSELEVPTAPRRGQLSWAELETPEPLVTDRRGLVSWAELETPTAPRRVQVSWVEVETPNGPRRALVSWAEIETPNGPRRLLLSFAEIEAPSAPRRGLVSWAELEAPDVTQDRRGRVSFAEFETPTAPRRAKVSWATLQAPHVGGDVGAQPTVILVDGRVAVLTSGKFYTLL